MMRRRRGRAAEAQRVQVRAPAASAGARPLRGRRRSRGHWQIMARPAAGAAASARVARLAGVEPTRGLWIDWVEYRLNGVFSVDKGALQKKRHVWCALATPSPGVRRRGRPHLGAPSHTVRGPAGSQPGQPRPATLSPRPVRSFAPPTELPDREQAGAQLR